MPDIIGDSIEEVRAAKDTEAEILKAGLCAMSVGAKNRKFPDEAAMIDEMCFGPKQQPKPPTLNAETLEVIRLLFAPRQPVHEE